jgi:hypothetical protein
MIGRDFVEYCLQNVSDYDIYIANRGVTNPGIFNCHHIKIDRDSQEGCRPLQEYAFDIVIDFSCYRADHLYNIISNLKYNRYYLISSTIVTNNALLQDESNPLYEYAKNKKHVEDYIEESNFKDQFTVIRPCIIYGENDYTGRFYKKDDNFYRTSDNSMVLDDEYHVNVKTVTQKILSAIKENTKSVVEVRGRYRSNFVLHPNESKYMSIERFDFPFRHIVIDNVFDNSTYNEMCRVFPTFIARTVPYKDQPGATSNYEGYILGLSLNDLLGGYEIFASKHLQNFVEKEFDIETTKFVSPSAHFHKPPSRDGFIHRDYNIVSFKDQQAEFVTTGGASYTDDTNENPDSTKVLRSIALLYYLNNDDHINCSGGGTAIYESYSGGHIKTIEPKNNRLFIFEMTDNSYHGFVGANFARSCVVSWFHSGPAYMINRHWNKYKQNNNLIERWSYQNTENHWKIESDPDYGKYFNRSLSELTSM